MNMDTTTQLKEETPLSSSQHQLSQEAATLLWTPSLLQSTSVHNSVPSFPRLVPKKVYLFFVLQTCYGLAADGPKVQLFFIPE